MINSERFPTAKRGKQLKEMNTVKKYFMKMFEIFHTNFPSIES